MRLRVEQRTCHCGGKGRYVAVSRPDPDAPCDVVVLCRPCKQDLFKFLLARGAPPKKGPPPEDDLEKWVWLFEVRGGL